MPSAPPRVCPRCRKLAPSGQRCACIPRPPDPKRDERWKPYASPEWRALRATHLKANPYCVVCGAKATIVDHVKPWKGDRQLFLDPGNLASMCKPHHDRKTNRVDGGFGNPIKSAGGRR